MMLYFGEASKLKTKTLVFEDVYAARDSATLEHLKELSSRRRVIEESINGSSCLTEAIAREMSGGLTTQCQRDLQKLEQYLPLLENLIFHVLSVRSAHWNPKLNIFWSSALSSSPFFNLRGPKFFQISNLQFERSMMLYLYAAMLRERAMEILPSDLVQSATCFREAAGVFNYLENEILPTLPSAARAERPPEAIPSMCNVMSLICLAEAQAVTIRKAEEKGTSFGLLAKLHYGVTEFLGDAHSVLLSVAGEYKDISPGFMDFVTSSKALHELRSQRYLAESLRSSSQVGLAIGILQNSLILTQKKVPGEESWKTTFRKETDAASDLLKKFQHENDFVWHEKIPSGDQLPLPQGSKIVKFIPYQPKRQRSEELSFKI